MTESDRHWKPMKVMKRRFLPLSAVLLGILAACWTVAAAAQSWQTVGPYGGDARSFASSPGLPSHILMGTTNSWIYQSQDDGATWARLSKISSSDSLVVDHIILDESNPNRVVVGAWMLDRPDGGIFVSNDQGRHWQAVEDMKGQSVRALAQAPSNPRIFVAGTLKGVYRSQDGGLHWTLISPPGSTEIHEVESIAIDPVHPEDIYAGTWHLPWRTQDGGRTWQNIKQGVIDDSDVFSIIVDPKQPDTVYASACSGIYKSIDSGTLFHKVQGIPSTARRTRVLKQDPVNQNIVYAGTTEGLYRTTDAGANWVLMTPNYLIINDILIDPRNTQHVLLATDRSGVLESNDGARSFLDSNTGFSQRQVGSMVTDPQNPDTIYVGVLNDKRFGGVFVSKDAGRTWQQESAGLEDHDVFTLGISPTGNILAGTNGGIYHLASGQWENAGGRLKESTRKVVHFRHKHRSVTLQTIAVPDGRIESSVRGLAFSQGEWFAATADGVYRSDDNGYAWQGGPIQGARAFFSIAAGGNVVLANAGSLLFASRDQGKTWQPVPLPAGWGRARQVAVDSDGRLWVAGRLGVESSENLGQGWQPSALPINNISGLQFDPQLKRVIVSSYDSDLVFGINPAARNWIWWNPGWRVHLVGSANGRLVAATLLHGVVIQPAGQMAQATGGSF